MSVLDERTCVAVEVDRLFGVEEHVLAGVDLEDEVFQGTHSHDAGNLLLLGLRHVGILASLVADTASIADHQFHQVVGIDHRTLAALHLAVGQLHHAVAEVGQFLAPLEAQTVEQDTEHLEVIVLLVAHHIYHLIDREVLETELGCAYVLSHIHRGAVRTKQEFLVQSFCSQVSPHRAVLAAIEEAFLQAFHHLLLTLQIGI
jgi:hypothetical protein